MSTQSSMEVAGGFSANTCLVALNAARMWSWWNALGEKTIHPFHARKSYRLLRIAAIYCVRSPPRRFHELHFGSIGIEDRSDLHLTVRVFQQMTDDRARPFASTEYGDPYFLFHISLIIKTSLRPAAGDVANSDDGTKGEEGFGFVG